MFTELQQSTREAVRQVAMSVIRDSMGVKPGESVLVVSDNLRKDLGIPIYEAALGSGAEAVYMEMKPRSVHGEEPPRVVADAMYDADVIVAVTRASLTHTRAKIEAVEHGARIATMPFGARGTDFVTRIFTTGGMTVDFKRMDANIHRLAERLHGTREARIVTKKGTDITIEYENREFREDSGIAHDPGDFTNLPAGEIYVAPVKADGVIVVDVTMGRIGRLQSPLTIEVRGCVATSIEGERADEIKKILAPYGPRAMNLAEFGIGMNPNARVCGLLLEDEKVAGTVHFALGSNAGFGGNVNVNVHMDGVIADPTIIVDGNRLPIEQYF